MIATGEMAVGQRARRATVLDRQLGLWDDVRMESALFLLFGGTIAGEVTALALALMGAGRVALVGRPANHPLARALAALPRPVGSTVARLARVSPDELDMLLPRKPDFLAVAAPDCRLAGAASSALGLAATSVASGSARSGVWLSRGTAADGGGAESSAAALVAGALLADVGRSVVAGGVTYDEITESPRASADLFAEPTNLGESSPRPCVALVGAGGIGSWVALVLAASGFAERLVVVDFDVVEESNLNRTPFRPADADRAAPKATTLASLCRELVPGARVEGIAGRIGPARGLLSLAEFVRAHDAEIVVSAVDNAGTRLHLSEQCAKLRVPLVHVGTTEGLAQCAVQLPDGESLDTQLHGALAAAARSEGRAARPAHRCAVDRSYVVPSLIAAAFAVDRVLRLELGTGRLLSDQPPALNWRVGRLPSAAERRTANPANVLEVSDAFDPGLVLGDR